MKKILMTLLMLLVFGSLTVMLIACGEDRGTGGTGETGGTTAAGDTVTVHTNAMSFEQSSVTIRTGQDLQLMNDGSAMHIIDLGTWQQGVAKPEQEPDAPQVHSEQLNGNGSLTLGPWTKPGTYQLYCPVHPNMNLTVVVQ